MADETRPLRALSGWSVGLAAALLSGCVQTLSQPVCPPSAQVHQATVRMLVSFRQATAGDAPDTLRQLQTHAHGCVTYLSSVSPSVHAYTFSGAGDAQALRLSLLTWNAVRDVVPDEKTQPAR